MGMGALSSVHVLLSGLGLPYPPVGEEGNPACLTPTRLPVHSQKS